LLKLIFHDRTFKADDEANSQQRLFGDPNILGSYAAKIQKAVKAFIERKYNSLDVPEEFVCSITGLLMKDPVLASDGNTYERDAITRWIGERRLPTHVRAGDITTADLIPNMSLRRQVMLFRDENKMHIPSPLIDTPAPAAQAKAAPRAPVAYRTYQPRETLPLIMRMAPYPQLHELFQKDGFLNELAKPGLTLILQGATGQIVHYDNVSKTYFIGQVMRCAADHFGVGYAAHRHLWPRPPHVKSSYVLGSALLRCDSWEH